MNEFLTWFFVEILSWREDYKFYKRKKERRKFEKENNLPKKILIHPVVKLTGILFILGFILFVTIPFFNLASTREKETKKKISEISLILDEEKKIIGTYPEHLNKIIRNNPLRKNIIFDYWKNEFYYQQTKNGQNYILISKGKDGILNTTDDIKKDK